MEYEWGDNFDLPVSIMWIAHLIFYFFFNGNGFALLLQYYTWLYLNLSHTVAESLSPLFMFHILQLKYNLQHFYHGHMSSLLVPAHQPGCGLSNSVPLRVYLPSLSRIQAGTPGLYHTTLFSEVINVTLMGPPHVLFCIFQSVVCNQLQLKSHSYILSLGILYSHKPDLMPLFQFGHITSLKLHQP